MCVAGMAVISLLSRANFQSSVSFRCVVSVLFCFFYAVEQGLSLLSNAFVICVRSSFSTALSTALRTVIGLKFPLTSFSTLLCTGT